MDKPIKTFTVTMHHTTNYGATLQAYALQQTILGMGFENTVFEYASGKSSGGKLKLTNPVYSAKILYTRLSRLLHKNAIQRKEAAFRTFHSERMNLSRVYSSMEDLRNDPPQADILITGSDQVWRFSTDQRFTPAKFLDFGAPEAKRFSYAASIEKLAYTQEQATMVKRWLAPYYRISLREQSAADYIREATGYDTVRVLDPVLLPELADWQKLAVQPKLNKPYILCYQVQNAPRMQEVADRLKKETGYDIVAVVPYSQKWMKADHTIFDASPEEFLGLYQNAAIIVSASFHGTAFGLTFGKPVYGVTRKSYAGRIYDIMHLLGADRFVISEDAELPSYKAFDLQGVAEKLKEERAKSLDYLRDCLG